MPRAALKVPLIHRVIRSRAPHEITRLALPAAPAVRVRGEGEAEAVCLVVQGDPEEVDGAVALVGGEDGEFVEVGDGGGGGGGGMGPEPECAAFASYDSR